jgi:uncharacterized protein RhaS with RHS repeats
LGWYAYGFRYYDPVICRFTGVDPIADQFAELSVYNYASNDPLGSVDLHGLQGIKSKELDEKGNLKRHIVKKNIVVLTREAIKVPDGASFKTIEKISKKNEKIEKKNQSKVNGVKQDVEPFFNGATNTKGENVSFDFNIIEERTSKDNMSSKTFATAMSLKHKIISSENDSKGRTYYAPAAVITTMDNKGNYGRTIGNIIQSVNSDGPEGTLAHEVGHTLFLHDSYTNTSSGYGLMGRPPSHIDPEEVDMVLSRALDEQKKD